MKVDSKVINSAASQSQGLGAQKAGDAKKKDLTNLGLDNSKSSAALKTDSAKVNLSSRAQEMKKASELASNSPDVDAEKVKKFQALIDSGAYKVDSKKVADKLVDEHLLNSALTDE